MFQLFLGENITWDYNRRMKYMKERVEEVYTTDIFLSTQFMYIHFNLSKYYKYDNDHSLITGIFVSCRKIARSKTPAKDNHDRY